MLTPNEDYLISVNTLKYSEELLKTVESLAVELEVVTELYNEKSGSSEQLGFESAHNAQMLINDIKG